MKIGVLSDTHSYLDPNIADYFKDCDEVWHLGDIGSMEVLESLEKQYSLRIVYGNIDDHIMRRATKEVLVFELEGMKVLMIHIGGYPDRYYAKTRALIEKHRPDLYLCGHSHILRVMRDKRYNLLHMNPGACGIYGIHTVRTLLRFELKDKNITNLEVVELGVRG